MKRIRWSISFTTVVVSSPTKAAANVRPAAKERTGPCRCSSGSKAGRGRLKDLDLLLEIGDTIGIIPGTTICGLATARLALKNAIRKFRGEFEVTLNEPIRLDARRRGRCKRRLIVDGASVPLCLRGQSLITTKTQRHEE